MDVGSPAPAIVTDAGEQLIVKDEIVLLKIEFLIIMADAFLVILVLFGSYRRRSSSAVLRCILWVAFSIPAIIVPYAIGLMHTAQFENKFFAVWTTFFVLVLGGSSSMSAYTLDDNEKWRPIRFAQLVQLFWAGWLLIQYAVYDHPFGAAVGLLLLLSIKKVADRFHAIQSACLTYGVASDSKVVADYMQYEHLDGSTERLYCPVTMSGYRYLVAGEESAETETEKPHYRMRLKLMDQAITVEQVWQCPGALLSDNMRDICLSFALFKMLRRRYAGYQLAESILHKTRDFVLNGLLLNSSGDHSSGDKGHERAFRVIEVELAFLYDSLYTKYPVIFYQWKLMLFKSCLMLLASVAAFVIIFFGHGRPSQQTNELHLVFDWSITYLVVLSIYILEIWQLFCYTMSDWTKVLAVCIYIRHPKLQGFSWLEQLMAFVFRGRFLNPWKRKLGQYSLISSCCYTPPPPRIWIQSILFLERTRLGQKGSTETRVSEEVKRTVADALRVCLSTAAQPISNGYASLQRNLEWPHQYQKFEWVFRLPNMTHAHKILIWHIATEMCMLGRAESNPITSEERVASDLSRYCAYLVAFVPELLPEHKFVTSCIFDEVVKEAKQAKSLERFKWRIAKREGRLKRKERLKRLEEEFTKSDDTVVCSGAKLARNLMTDIADEGRRWKLLAELWAEMLLYLAPSDNVRAHAERLARGGEFITHLWALLTHAGVLQRPDGSDLV